MEVKDNKNDNTKIDYYHHIKNELDNTIIIKPLQNIIVNYSKDLDEELLINNMFDMLKRGISYISYINYNKDDDFRCVTELNYISNINVAKFDKVLNISPIKDLFDLFDKLKFEVDDINDNYETWHFNTLEVHKINNYYMNGFPAFKVNIINKKTGDIFTTLLVIFTNEHNMIYIVVKNAFENLSSIPNIVFENILITDYSNYSIPILHIYYNLNNQ